MISQSEIGTPKPREYLLRTVDQHDKFVDELKQNPTLKSVNGVKRECVLSKHLTSFHPVTGFPPDILHDFCNMSVICYSSRIGIVPFRFSF